VRWSFSGEALASQLVLQNGSMSEKNSKPRNKKIWVPHIVSIAMLIWALYPDNPYGYYTLLRFICCACFAFIAFRYHETGKETWVWIFAVAAIIYNPFIRIHLSREIWSVANIATILIISASLYTQNKKP